MSLFIVPPFFIFYICFQESSSCLLHLYNNMYFFRCQELFSCFLFFF
nr:MAG TPA: hypothetical protein [Caudoviricetes sp.]DAS55867.1 MAG TPA: hypothetical protein [Caudoviricetes sp.]DAT15386.1 MAG TPA: hypothetical protein [Caudoviricetes sp.]DAX98148.1 MAG TPA: hypothetical protein [Caudoviricetes sp.]